MHKNLWAIGTLEAPMGARMMDCPGLAGLNEISAGAGFDGYVEKLCSPFHAKKRAPPVAGRLPCAERR